MGCGPSLQPKKVASLHTLSHTDVDEPHAEQLLLASRGAKPKLFSGDTAKKYQRRSFRQRKYAALFAVDCYTYMTHLSAAVADAHCMAKCLSNLGFKVVVQLYNEACTLPALQQKLRDCATKLSTEARVLFFFAGHGLRHNLTGRTFYCTVHTDKNNLLSTGFDVESIFTLMDFMPKQQAWVMDFCFSGGACMSTVRRGSNDWEDESSPSIAVMTAGKSGESVVESDLIETPTCSPMVTPQITPEASPKHEPNSQFFDDGENKSMLPLAVPHAPTFQHVPVKKTKGLFTHCLARELKKVHARHRHRGQEVGKSSLTQVFVAVRSEVVRQSQRLGVQQTPQLSRIHWYRQKKAEGEFFF